MPPLDKRDYLRIDQDVIFNYQIIDAKTAKNAHTSDFFNEDPALHLLSQIQHTNKDSKRILSTIQETQRLVGDYLKNIDDKIDLLTRFCLQQTVQSQSESKKRINLSEGGLAFSSQKALYKDNFMVLRLIFLPSYMHVVTFAQVLRCKHNETDNQIAVKFYNITEKERQCLSKHILQSQRRSKTQVGVQTQRAAP